MMGDLGNDMKKLLAMRGEFKAGTVTLTDVLHDDWCAKLNGGAICNCDPEIRTTPISGPKDGGNGHGA
jgi:hypothetical protein